MNLCACKEQIATTQPHGFTSPYRFNEGGALKNHLGDDFSERASLQRRQHDQKPSAASSRIPLKNNYTHEQQSAASSRIPLKNNYAYEQSGLYYGARYYNPTMSSLHASGGWLVVYPLAHYLVYY